MIHTFAEKIEQVQESFEKHETQDNLLERQISLGDIERDEMNQEMLKQEKNNQVMVEQGNCSQIQTGILGKIVAAKQDGRRMNGIDQRKQLLDKDNHKNLNVPEEEVQVNDIEQQDKHERDEDGNFTTFVQNENSVFGKRKSVIVDPQEVAKIKQKEHYDKNINMYKSQSSNTQTKPVEQETKETSNNNEEEGEQGQEEEQSSAKDDQYSKDQQSSSPEQISFPRLATSPVKIFPQGYIAKLKEDSTPVKSLIQEQTISPSSGRSIVSILGKDRRKTRASGTLVGFTNDIAEETPKTKAKRKTFVFSSKLIDDQLEQSNNNQNEDPRTPSNFNAFTSNSFLSRLAGQNEGTILKAMHLSPTKVRSSDSGWNFAVKLKNINRFISKIRDQTSEGNFTRLLPRHLNLIKDASFSPEGGSSQFFDTEKKLSSSEQLAAKIQIFEPDDFYLVLFKCVLLLILTVEVFLLPVEVGFDIDLLFFNASSKLFLRDLPIALFSLDLVFRLNTGYYINGSLMKQRSYILRHFGWLIFLDFLNILALILQDIVDYQILIVIFLLRMLLLHEKSSDLLENFAILERYPAIYNLIKLVFIQLIAGHVSGCGFHFISTIDIGDNLQTSWIKFYNFAELSIASRYLLSIYYATITMITVGYGDITPRNALERIYVIAIVIISGTVFAYTVNMIGAIFQEKEKKLADYKQMKSDISNYMTNRQISKKTQLKVYNYLDYINQKANESPEKGQMILSKISESLKNDVYREFYGQILTNSKLFHNKFSAAFIEKVSLRMEEKMNGPGEIIVLEGSQYQPCLYYILKGKVEMFSEREDKRYSLGYLNQGDSFGHRCFHSSEPQEWSAVTTEVTHLVYVSQKNFLDCVKDFQSDLETFMVMKEEIIFGQNRYMNPCYSCGKMTHISVDCPLIHYHRNKQLCVNKYLYYAPQKDRHKFRRDRAKFNALKEALFCKEKLKMCRMALSIAVLGNKQLEVKEIEMVESESDKEFFQRMQKFHFDENNNLVADSLSNNELDEEDEDDEDDMENQEYSDECIEETNNQEKINQNCKKNNNNTVSQMNGSPLIHSNRTGNNGISAEIFSEIPLDSQLYFNDQVIEGATTVLLGDDNNLSNHFLSNTPQSIQDTGQTRKRQISQEKQYPYGPEENGCSTFNKLKPNKLPKLRQNLQNIQELSESNTTLRDEKTQRNNLNKGQFSKQSIHPSSSLVSSRMAPSKTLPSKVPSNIQSLSHMQPIRLHNDIGELNVNSFSLDDSFSPKYAFEQKNMEIIIANTDNLLMEHLESKRKKSRLSDSDSLQSQTPYRKISGYSNQQFSDLQKDPNKQIQQTQKSNFKKTQSSKKQQKQSQTIPKDPPKQQQNQPPDNNIQRKSSIQKNIHDLRRYSNNTQSMQHLLNHLVQLQQIDVNSPQACNFSQQQTHFQQLHLPSGLHNTVLNPQFGIVRKKEEFFIADFENMREYVIYFPSQNYSAIIKKINLKVKINRLKKISEAPIPQIRKSRKRFSTFRTPNTFALNTMEIE